MKTWTKRTTAVCLLLALFLTAIPCASAKQYTDVTRSALPDYFDAINYVTDNGIMNGVSTSSFSPNEMVTRAMFITTLYRYAGSPSSFAAVSFTDISSSHYAYNAVKWGVKYNIVTGTTTTTFSPDEQVTREQAMTFLWRYLKNYVGGTPYYYGSISGCGDYSSIYDYARTPMYWAVSNAIIFASGSSKLLYPKAGVYRKELALWITRYGCNVDGIRLGKDNFSFTNNASAFHSPTKDRRLMSSAFYNKAYEIATDSERDKILDVQLRKWRGVCYGMCLSVILDKKGITAINENSELDSKTMYSMKAPTTNTGHIYVRDRLDSQYYFTQLENVINYNQTLYQINSIMKHKYYNFENGETCATLIKDLRTYGILVLSFFWRTSDKTLGHAVVLYGMPKVAADGGYDINVYDPNSLSRQTLHISADLKECTFSNRSLKPYMISYDADFYNFYSLDLDGDYNLSMPRVQNSECSNGRMKIALDVDGKYRIENQQGTVFTFDKMKTGGDMPIYNSYVENNFDETSIAYFEIPESDTIRVYFENDATVLYIIRNDAFQKVIGTGIQEVYVTTDSMEINGTNSNCSVRYFQNNETKRVITVQGNCADTLLVDLQQSDLLIWCDAEFKYALNEAFTETIFSGTVAAQSNLTIRNPWGAQADVEVEVQP